jgi:hypothetical protein
MKYTLNDIDNAIRLNEKHRFTKSVLLLCKELMLGNLMWDKDGIVIPKRKPEVGDSWLVKMEYEGEIIHGINDKE